MQRTISRFATSAFPMAAERSEVAKRMLGLTYTAGAKALCGERRFVKGAVRSFFGLGLLFRYANNKTDYSHEQSVSNTYL